MAGEIKRAEREEGTIAVGRVGSGQWSVWGGDAGVKVVEGGFRARKGEPDGKAARGEADRKGTRATRAPTENPDRTASGVRPDLYRATSGREPS